MQRKIKIAISCIITVCLTVCFLSNLTDLMERKASRIQYSDFFDQEEDFDVLFVGTSHVMNGVFPMELWDDYGIISYNFGGHANRLPTTYWVMQNALEHTTPKVVVIDCLYLSRNEKCSEAFSNMHLSFDAFPLNMTKIKATWDLLDDPVTKEALENGTRIEYDEPRTRIGLLWDYSVYHSRWTEIGQGDFKPSQSYEKGAESRISVARGNPNKISSEQKMELGTTGEQYLRKMIEDCQDREIEVLLIYLPFPASEEEQKEANYVYDIAEEYGVNYINFLDMDLINYETDLYDLGSHLNPSGARKVSDHLGEYLISNYDISDQRNNEDYSFWYEDYEEYNKMKDRNIVECSSIEEYLMLLSRDDVDITMDIRNKDIFHNAWMVELLGNLGISANELTEDTDFIIIKNGGEDAVVINDLREEGEAMITEVGKVQIFYDTDGSDHNRKLGYYRLYIDGNECMVGNMDDDTSLQIRVTRGDKVVDTVKFVYTVDPETTIVSLSAANR
ncbi:MAG: hypothetical protein J1E64_14740 [Acetatifactor sp.]|nr:hypothetical protein [Acetatifactor sp.]